MNDALLLFCFMRESGGNFRSLCYNVLYWIFIAFDKQNAYRPSTRQILESNRVLQLSDNGCELYGESWNKEKKQTDADEL